MLAAPIKIFSQFRKIRALTKDMDVLVDALRTSKVSASPQQGLCSTPPISAWSYAQCTAAQLESAECKCHHPTLHHRPP